MQRETMNTGDVSTPGMVVILDSLSAAFITQEQIEDVNGFINELLEKELKNQTGQGLPPGQPGYDSDSLADGAPDTAGVRQEQPELKPGGRPAR